MALQNIDFLPDVYRETRIRRQQKVWRRGALALFLLLMVAGALGQRQIRARLDVTYNKLRTNADRMTAQIGDPRTLQKEIERLDGEANLLAMLQLRVPPTRILAAITNALPQYVTLSEFQMQSEMLPPPPAPTRGEAPPPAPPPPATPPVKPLPEKKDLDDLRKVSAETALVVSMQGIAPHEVAVAGYLAALQQTGVFSEVTLQHIDREVIDKVDMRRFKLRLRVKRPGRPNS